MAKKTNIPDPLSEIATNLVATLESHRENQKANPETPFLNWSQLVASQTGVSMDWATAAIKKSPAKANVIIAIPDDLKSPVGLQSDLEKLAADSGVLIRLVQHPSTGCSVAAPVRSLNELCKNLDKTLKKPTETFWTQHYEKVPSGLNAVAKKAGKKVVVAIHDERFSRPDVVLCQKLVKNLESLRSAGEAHYPAEFKSLLTKVDIAVDDPMLVAAIAQPQFSEATSVIAGKMPNAWIAFRKDAEQCLGTEGFLKRLLLQQCNEATPEVKLSVLAKQLIKEFQPRFMELWRTHSDMNRSFGFVEFTSAGSKSKPDLLLRDARFPRAERLLSAQLVKTLEGQKVVGGAAYPLTWNRLVELSGSKADLSLLQKATTVEPFSDRVLVAFPALADSTVAFLADAADLAASAATLDAALSLLLNDENQAIASDKLAAVRGMNLLFKGHFATAVERFVTLRQWPPGFAALKLSSKWHIFRMKDLSGTLVATTVPEEQKSKARKGIPSQAIAPVPPNPAAPAVPTQPQATAGAEDDGFAQALEAAFEQLSAISRLPGCVSLVDLRPAMASYSRDVFDSQLIRLRKTGQYSLSVVEGRYPLSDDEKAACLTIDNSAHLLLQKRTS